MAWFLQYKCSAGPRVSRASHFAWICGLLLFIALATGCEEIEPEKPWIHVDRPQMLFTDTTLLDCYDKDVLSWKLKTAYLERWSDKEVVFMRPVLVDIYDSVGERVAFLRADSGRMDMSFSYVYAYGHVYALTPKGASVRADSLLWNKRDDMVRTESYVRVVSEDGDVLQGKGFESDARMENWRILANVTGIFQDAAKRMKEEDKKQAEELEKKNDSAATPAVAHPAPTQAPKAAPGPAPLPARPALSGPPNRNSPAPQPSPAKPASSSAAGGNAAPAAAPAKPGSIPRFMNPAAKFISGAAEIMQSSSSAKPEAAKLADDSAPAAGKAANGQRPRAKRRE